MSVLAVIRADRFGDIIIAVSPYEPGQALLDIPDQPGPAIYQGGIELNKRCAGPDFGIGVRAAGNAAASDSGGDGEEKVLTILYWQAASLPGPYLSGDHACRKHRLPAVFQLSSNLLTLARHQLFCRVMMVTPVR